MVGGRRHLIGGIHFQGDKAPNQSFRDGVEFVLLETQINALYAEIVDNKTVSLRKKLPEAICDYMRLGTKYKIAPDRLMHFYELYQEAMGEEEVAPYAKLATPPSAPF